MYAHPQQLITAQQRNGRPLTPSAGPIVVDNSQNVSSTGTPNNQQNAQQQYSILPNQGYYDQNGLLTNTTNNRATGTPMRMLGNYIRIANFCKEK